MNGVPDTCDADCDGNGAPDGYDLSTGSATDRNDNDTLDRCDIAANPSLDRNLNGELDGWEIAQNPPLDSNANGILDQVELAAANAAIAALNARLACGDLNGDGEVDGADLGILLVGWGECH